MYGRKARGNWPAVGRDARAQRPQFQDGWPVTLHQMVDNFVNRPRGGPEPSGPHGFRHTVDALLELLERRAQSGQKLRGGCFRALTTQVFDCRRAFGSIHLQIL